MRKILCALNVGLLSLGVVQAATYNWNGGGSNSRWTTAGNWAENERPSSDNTTDLIFGDGVRDSGSLYADWTVRSLTFDDTIDADDHAVSVSRAAAFQRTLSFEADTGNSTLTIAAGATGDVAFNEGNVDPGNEGDIVLNNSLDIVHNGSGTLSFNLAVNQETGDANGINKSGSGTMILSGVNTYTGDTVVSAGTLTLSDDAQLLFDINDSANNGISGSGTLNLDGDFSFDLTDATVEAGDSWMIVDVDNLDVTFGATFSVDGFTDAGDDTWTKDIDGEKWYEFSEATGVLRVVYLRRLSLIIFTGTP